MAEYIKRDDMRAVLEKASINARFADEPPAADVEPVRHGRWEYVTNVSKTRGWFACSKCGSSPPYKASGIL